MMLGDVFKIEYGGKFPGLQNSSIGSTPVVTSGGSNNGVAGFYNIKSNYRNVISVARTGSVGSTFYHEYECYITDDCIVCIPKKSLSVMEMLYYTTIISQEKYKYAYARKVTPQRLSLTNVPIFKPVAQKIVLQSPSDKPLMKQRYEFNINNWKDFKYSEIFNIEKGYYNKKPYEKDAGDVPFIGATERNNGVTSFHSMEAIEFTSKDGSGKNHDISKKLFEDGKYITISNGGSIGNAFYQPKKFTCAHHVNPLSLQNYKMNPFIGMFLCTLIKLEKYRYLTCGREMRLERMPNMTIKLPITPQGNPDWEFMENYIKSLPYSSSL